MNDFDSYLATIDELVEDEDKIVTYKLLSHQLALPVNKAKEVLKHYLTHNESGKLCAVYALTGRCKGKITVSVVPADKLDEAKSKLDSLLSCHVYSVQKSNLMDPTPLYNVDYDLTKSMLYKCASFGMIRYHGAKQLSDEDVQNLRLSTITIDAESTSTQQTKPTNQVEKKSSKKEQKSFFAPKSSTKTQKDNRSDPKESTEVQNGGGESTSAKPALAPVKPTKRKGMDVFMTKGKSNLFESHKPPTKNLQVQNSEKPPPSPPKNGSADISLNDAELLELSEKMEVDDFDTNEKQKSPEKEKEEKVSKPSKPKAASKKTKPNRSKANSVPTKKRKRIREIVSSSSSSSESEEDFDTVDVIPPSPEAPPAKVNTAPKNPRKKRVLKSHTYVDADRSMLTEKVWEEVSCSSGEDEKDTVAKENQSPLEVKTVPKKAAVIKGKQSTLMGFFNKKS